MTNHCATCRYWNLNYRDRDFGEPGDPLMGTCKLARSQGGRPEHGTLAWAEDFEGYAADLKTHPDFGCVQWKPAT